MAKKRRLSKRDREIKRRIWIDKAWVLALKDEGFMEKLTLSTKDLDPSLMKVLVPEGITLKCCLSNGEEILKEYEVAILTETGAFVYSKPFSDEDIPF